MAILFVSPKIRQRMFIRIIVAMTIVLLFVIFLIIFPPQFISNRYKNYSNGANVTPDLKINFEIVDSKQFKNLQLFSESQIEFSYIAKDKNGKQIIGIVLAANRNVAKMVVEQMNLTVLSLEEKNIGRSEPFSPYY